MFLLLEIQEFLLIETISLFGNLFLLLETKMNLLNQNN